MASGASHLRLPVGGLPAGPGGALSGSGACVRPGQPDSPGPAQSGGRPGDVRSGCGPERPQTPSGRWASTPWGLFHCGLGGMSLSLACYFLIASSTVAAFSYIGILMVLSMALDNLGQYVNPLFTSLYHLDPQLPHGPAARGGTFPGPRSASAGSSAWAGPQCPPIDIRIETGKPSPF